LPEEVALFALIYSEFKFRGQISREAKHVRKICQERLISFAVLFLSSQQLKIIQGRLVGLPDLEILKVLV